MFIIVIIIAAVVYAKVGRAVRNRNIAWDETNLLGMAVATVVTVIVAGTIIQGDGFSVLLGSLFGALFIFKAPKSI